MGHAPLKTTYYPKTGMCRALFPKDCCEDCPHKNDCKSKPQKKNYAVHASASMVSRARYSEKLSTAKYIELTRLRNAIKGIPSVLRRKYHIDEIPVFGKLCPRQFFLFKIGEYNFGKLFRRNRRLQVESAQNLVMAWKWGRVRVGIEGSDSRNHQSCLKIQAFCWCMIQNMTFDTQTKYVK